MSTILRRKEIPLVIASIIVIITLIEYYLDVPVVRDVYGLVMSWGVIIAGFAMGLGASNLTIISLRSIAERRKGIWYFDLWTVLIMALFIITGLIGTIGTHPVFAWMYNYIIVPLSATMYGLLAFYLFSSGYRTFRMRNWTSITLMVSALFVALWYAPVGPIIWSGFDTIGAWIMNVPNVAGSRVILIGVALGAVTYGIRVLLMIERRIFGG